MSKYRKLLTHLVNSWLPNAALKVLLWGACVLLLLSSPNELRAEPPGITYQGRMVDSYGQPLQASLVPFVVAISASPDCVLYSESFNVDMSSGTGHFALILGEGQRTDPSNITLHQIFNPSLKYPKLEQCPQGLMKKTADKLYLSVSFNPGSGPQTLAPIEITATPFAVDTINVAGVASSNVVRVKDGPATELTKDDFAELQALLDGSSSQYAKANQGKAHLTEADIPQLTTADKVSGNTITSGTIGGTTSISTSGSIRTSTDMMARSLSGSTEASGTLTLDSTTDATKGSILLHPNGGKVGVGTITPTAKLHIGASNGTIHSAPLKISPGTVLSTPEPGAIEFDGVSLFYTTSDGVRQTIGAAGSGITALAGDVTASGNGSATAVVNSVGGATANQIKTASTEVNDKATSASTVSVLVKRDPSGVSSFKGLKLDGATSGTLTHTVPTAVTSYTLTWPGATPGAANAVLTSDTSGNLSWINLGSIAGTINLNTQTTGILPVAKGGTNSSATLANNRVIISSSGAMVEAPAITAAKALVSDANGLPTHSTVTSAELSHVSGVTSAIQTQLNSKPSTTGWTNFSVIGVGATGTLTAFPGTTSGTLLQHSATGPAWSSAVYPSTTSANSLLYSSSNNVVTGLATANNAMLTTNSSGVPNWSPLSNDTFTQYALLAGRAGGQTLFGGTAASNDLKLESTTNATKGNVLLATTGGNVGIGPISPAYKLHLTNIGMAPSTEYKLAVFSDSISTGSGVLLGYYTNPEGTATQEGRVRSGNGVPLAIGTQAFPQALYIQNTYGNIGIGTTQPNFAGANPNARVLTISGDGTISNARGVLELANPRSNASLASNDVAGNIFFTMNNNGGNRANSLVSSIVSVLDGSGGPNGFGGKILFQTKPDAVDSVAATRMTIDQSGNVGIGTSTPYSKLFVAGGEGFIDYGSGGTSNGGALRLATNANRAFIGSNHYYNGFGRYARTGGAGIISFDITTGASAGDIQFQTFPSGTADSIMPTATNVMTMKQAGNVGIGTTSPISLLHIEHATDSRYTTRFSDPQTNAIAGFQALSDTGIGGFILATAKGTYKHVTTASDGDTYLTSRQNNNNLIFGTNSVERMRIGANGNVSIGTTSTNEMLSVNGRVLVRATSAQPMTGLFNGTLTLQSTGNEDTVVARTDPSATNAAAGIFHQSSGAPAFDALRVQSVATTSTQALLNVLSGVSDTTGIGGESRFFVRGDGNIGIGTTTPGYKLDVNGAINIATGNSLRFAGTSVCTSTGCTSSSDARLKENITPLKNSLEKTLQIRGVEYDYKDKIKFGNGHHVGVIAQEIEPIFPEVVITDTESGLKAVAYDHLVAPMIEAIKTLYARITTLEADRDQQSEELASLNLLKADKSDLKALREENTQLKGLSQQLISETRQLKLRAEKAEKEVETLKSENTKMKTENRAINSRLDAIEKRLNF